MNLLNGKSLEELIDIDIRTIDQEGNEDCIRIQKELEKSPNDPEVWFNLGLAYVDSAITRHFLICRKADIDAANAARKAEEETLAKTECVESADNGEDKEVVGVGETVADTVSELNNEEEEESCEIFSPSDDPDRLSGRTEPVGNDPFSGNGNCCCMPAIAEFVDIDAVAARPFCEKALNCFQQTLQLEPEYYGVQCQMGVTYIYLKDYNAAEKCFKKAIDEDDEDFSAIYYLGQTYHAMGNEAMAKLYLDRAEEQQQKIDDLEHI